MITSNHLGGKQTQGEQGAKVSQTLAHRARGIGYQLMGGGNSDEDDYRGIVAVRQPEAPAGGQGCTKNTRRDDFRESRKVLFPSGVTLRRKQKTERGTPNAVKNRCNPTKVDDCWGGAGREGREEREMKTKRRTWY